MEKINWSPEYSVGVGIIDAQHKKVVLMLNRLIGAKDTTTRSEVISDLLTQMTAYAQEHFKIEEYLSAEMGFPLLDQHKLSHIEYRKKVVDFCRAVSLNVPDVSQEVLNFLANWWRKHILEEDMGYKLFFKKKGIHI